MVVEGDGQAVVERAGPARFACGHGRHRVAEALGGPVGRQQLEVGEAAPEGHPGHSGEPGSERAVPGHRPTRRPSLARPDQDGDEGVEDDGAGVAGYRRRAGEHAAQALAEPPDPDRPGDRGGQRGPHRRAPEQAEGDEELDGGEQCVPQPDVVRHDVIGPEHRPADHRRVAGCSRLEHVHNEAPREHGGLELQGGVEQPDEPEGDLQATPPTVDGHDLSRAAVDAGRTGVASRGLEACGRWACGRWACSHHPFSEPGAGGG